MHRRKLLSLIAACVCSVIRSVEMDSERQQKPSPAALPAGAASPSTVAVVRSGEVALDERLLKSGWRQAEHWIPTEAPPRSRKTGSPNEGCHPGTGVALFVSGAKARLNSQGSLSW